jgi:hypothetical protein
MRGAALLALGALAGCGVLQKAPRGPEADAWDEARARWTRAAHIYDRFVTHALATATYESPELRRRRVDRVAAWKAMTAEEKAAAMAAEEADGARWEEFLVSLFTVDAQDNDLDDRRSVWRVALVLEDGEMLPAEIRTRKVDSLLRDLYPSIKDHDIVYRVRFPLAKGEPLAGRPFTLRIAGSEGKMDFGYRP